MNPRCTWGRELCRGKAIAGLLLFGGLPAALGTARAGLTERVSIDTSGTQADGGSSTHVDAISSDGRFVAFASLASNLVSGDSNGASDVFVHDRTTGSTVRVSVASDGTQGNGGSTGASISDDGRYVSFASDASNLVVGDGNSRTDVFVHDRVTGSTVRVSVSTLGVEGNGRSPENSGAHLSADGRFVVFPSLANNLVTGDANGATDVFIRDLIAGTTELVSRSSSGTQGNGLSAWAFVSSDGRYVTFTSLSTNLVPSDTNNTWDIFVRDLQTGTVERASVGTGGVQANANSGYSSLSDDSRFVAFFSYASNLVTGDTNGIGDIFVYDRQTAVTERVSVASDGTQGLGPNVEVGVTSLSADGNLVAFYFGATNLVPNDTNGASDVFVHNRDTNETVRASVDSNDLEANAFSVAASISGDGRSVTFNSAAANLVTADTNGTTDVFVHSVICDTGTLRFAASVFPVSENVSSASITVSLCGSAVGSVSVDYSTASGTASPGSDYTDVSGTITFADGETGTKTFMVPILDDVLAEASETVFLTLSNLTGSAVLGSPNTATLTIGDCEQAFEFSASSFSILESDGMATITVRRSGCGPGVGSMTVEYSTVSGTATPGADYTAVSGTLSFADGQLVKTFQVPIIDDAYPETDETLDLVLSNPLPGAVLGPLAVLTIQQSDNAAGSSKVKIAMHIRGPFSKFQQACNPNSYPADCRNNVVTGDLNTPYFVYILVAGQDADGVGGTQFGVDYGSELLVSDWSLCAALNFPTSPGSIEPTMRYPRRGHFRPRSAGLDTTWPLPGSGNRITWDIAAACPQASSVPAGFLYTYAYAPAQLSITPWPGDNRATLVDCSGSESEIPALSLGTVGFGGASGCNPCQPTTNFPPPDSCSVVAQQGNVLLGWAPVTNATQYQIFRDGVLIAEIPSPVTEFLDQPYPGSFLYEIRSATPCEVSLPCASQVTVIGISDESTPGRPLSARLLSNPARSRAEFAVQLEAPAEVLVETYDILGRRISSQGLIVLPSGVNTVRWDGRDDAGRAAPSGIYFTRILAGTHEVNLKFLLLR